MIVQLNISSIISRKNQNVPKPCFLKIPLDNIYTIKTELYSGIINVFLTIKKITLL